MFKEHGTKIIGGAVTVLGVVAGINPAILAALGPWGIGAGVVAGGLWTILRGFQNSGIVPGGPEAVQKPKE